MEMLLMVSGNFSVLIVFALDTLVSSCSFISLSKFLSAHFNKILSELFMHS